MMLLAWTLIIAALFYTGLIALRAFVSRRIAKALNEVFERNRK